MLGVDNLAKDDRPIVFTVRSERFCELTGYRREPMLFWLFEKAIRDVLLSCWDTDRLVQGGTKRGPQPTFAMGWDRRGQENDRDSDLPNVVKVIEDCPVVAVRQRSMSLVNNKPGESACRIDCTTVANKSIMGRTLDRSEYKRGRWLLVPPSPNLVMNAQLRTSTLKVKSERFQRRDHHRRLVDFDSG